MKKLLLLAWAVIAAFSLNSCSKDDDEKNGNSEPFSSATVHIEQEGTLRDVLKRKNLYSDNLFTFNVISLKITGVLGEDDWDVFSAVNGPLRNLDLSEVTSTSIPQKTFWGRSLHSLILPNNLVTIGEGAFAYSELTSIEIPASVVAIGDQAFYRCPSLQSITFEKGSKLKTIGKGAFVNSPLTSVEIPASVENIGESAIGACSSLSTITFEKESKLKTIGKHAFTETALTSIEIPASVENIGEYAISFCSSLSTITFEKESNLKTIEKGAFVNSPLTSVEIPASVENIGESAFVSTVDADYGDSKLVTVSFERGSKLKTIGGNAFMNCTNLMTFDASYCTQLNSIESGAFDKCNSLQLFKIGTITPPSARGAFYDSVTFAILKVPAESVEAYKKNNQWNKFSNISALN